MNQQQLLFLFLFFYFTHDMSWKQFIVVGCLMVGSFIILIYITQEKILYSNDAIPPRRTSQNISPYRSPKEHNLEYEDVWLTTSDNLRLHAWFIYGLDYNKNKSKNNPKKTICDMNNEKKNNGVTDNKVCIENENENKNHNEDNGPKLPTIIWYHANAGNMGHRLPNIAKMHQELKANIFILSYRGYGESEGEPNEEGLKIDAKTAFEYILNRDDVDKTKIFIFGRSLGGAIATYVASLYGDKIAGLILENTFMSISDMVGQVFPFLNFDFVKKYMLKMHWRTVDLIPNLKIPILFLASEKDEIVPHSQMLKLHDSASASSYKLIHVIPKSTHNDAWLEHIGGNKYWNAMKQFIDDCINSKFEKTMQ